MDCRTVSMIIDGVKCPLCNRTIKVTRANDLGIAITHDSARSDCAEFINTLNNMYLETINDKLTLRELKAAFQ